MWTLFVWYSEACKQMYMWWQDIRTLSNFLLFLQKKSELILRYCCSFILFLKYKLIYTHLCTAILPKHLQKWWFLTLVYPFCYCGSRGLLKRIFIRFKQSLCGYHSSRLEKWNLCLGIPPLVVAHIKKNWIIKPSSHVR